MFSLHVSFTCLVCMFSLHICCTYLLYMRDCLAEMSSWNVSLFSAVSLFRAVLRKRRALRFT